MKRSAIGTKPFDPAAAAATDTMHIWHRREGALTFEAIFVVENV
jgi:hypothetical protein